MRAFHGDVSVQRYYLDRVEAHRVADEIVQGYGYWERGRGCAVGCTLHSDDHGAYETELGIPRILARLQDRIFEGLPAGEHAAFPGDFLRAPRVGADLSGVWVRWALWMLADPSHGVARHDASGVIERVAALYRRRVAGDAPSAEEWRAAAEAAWHCAARDELLRLMREAPLVEASS